MAKVLKDLLANDHPLFLMNIARLERASGNAGIDTRLIGEIAEKGYGVMRQLGLDPSDTTAEELYRALLAASRQPEKRRLFADTAYVLLNLGVGPVSLNLRDIIENAHHELPFDKRVLSHAQNCLRAELVRRYAEHERTHDDFVYEVAEEIGMSDADDKDEVDITSYLVEEPHEAAPGNMPYVLAIGDIFTDAFIKLNDNEARVTKDEDGKEWLAVEFGAKMPYDQVDIVRSVGPSPNAAVSFSRLGLDAGLMAYLGDDDIATESLGYLREQRVDTETMRQEPGKKSSYWYVLRYGADRTMLVKNEDYDYAWQAPARTPDWVYLSQISPNAWGLHENLLAYLDEHKAVKLAFQPGTSHFRWGTEKLRRIYERSYIVVMNREEAMDVTGEGYDSVYRLAKALHELGPEIVVITDGPKGSYAYYDDKLVTIPNYPDPAPPYERTGAGDAFASTIVAALARGEAMDTALTWAPVNSAYVVQKMGAQAGLLTYDELQKHLSAAPNDYKVTEMEKQ